MDIQPRLFEHVAKTIFGSIETRCRQCVGTAEKIWNNACVAEPRLRKAARGRGRNSIFNELVADCARQEFGEAADVEVCEQYGTVRLHYKGEFDVGFKKIDSRGRFAAYLTPRRKRYNGQLELFGDPLPKAIRLHIAYEWNNAATEIIDVYLSYPLGGFAVWKYPLRKDEGGAGGPMLMPMPITPPAPGKFRKKGSKEAEAKKKKA